MVIERLVVYVHGGSKRSPAAGHRSGAKTVAGPDVIDSNSVRGGGSSTPPRYNPAGARGFDLNNINAMFLSSSFSRIPSFCSLLPSAQRTAHEKSRRKDCVTSEGRL